MINVNEFIDNKLQVIVRNIHRQILIECFSSNDIRLYDLACAELEKRGYEIKIDPAGLIIEKEIAR